MSTLYHSEQPSPIPTTSGIYQIRCVITGKFYIGSSVNLYLRWKKHHNSLNRNDHENAVLQRTWNKYGEQAFIFEVIELVLIPFLLEREQYWLDTLQPFGNKGFNIAKIAGSSFTGMKHTPETREKMSLAQLGHTHTQETRERLRAFRLGRKATPEEREKMSINRTNPSPETRKRMRDSHLGMKHTPETREKMSLAQRGRTHSAETRVKIGAAHLGKPGPNLGKKASPETRAKISAAKTGLKPDPKSYAHRMKTLIVTSPEGTEYVVCGIKAFCKEHNLHQYGLKQVAQGVYSQHKGWKARFPETDII